MVRGAFAGLAREVAQSTGIERTAEELAQGCLAIANDNMANAIKEISVQRGIDVTQGYALCCFGGAGSQHACQVADLLGIGRCSSTPMPPSCRPTAWAWPTCASCASRRSNGRSTRGWSPSWRRRWPCRRRGRAELHTQEVAERASCSRPGSTSATPAPTPRSRCRWRDAAAVRAASRPSTVPATASSSRAGAWWSRRSRSRASARMEAVAEPEPTRDRRPARAGARAHHAALHDQAPHQPAERFEAAVYTREALLPGDRVPARRWSAAPPPRSWSSPAGRWR